MVLNKEQELQLDPLKVRANIFRPEAKTQDRIGEREQKYFRMLLDRSLAGDSSQKRGVASEGYTLVDIEKNNVIPSVKPNPKSGEHGSNDKGKNENYDLSSAEEVNVGKKFENLDTKTNENYSCDIRKIDILKKDLKTLKSTRGKSSFVQNVFCEGNSGISSHSNEWKRRLTVMQYFNRCEGTKDDKSFVEILANGIQASGCRANNIELSCKKNLVNQLITACEKIKINRDRPIGMGDKIISSRIQDYIMACRTSAFQYLDLFSGYQTKNHKNAFGIKNLKRVLNKECGNDELIRSRKGIEAALFNIEQKEMRELGKSINFKSINLKKKYCANLNKIVNEKLSEQSANFNPVDKISYNIIYKNLPDTEKLISNWSDKEAAAFLLFNESALSIGEELKICTSNIGNADGIRGIGNVK